MRWTANGPSADIEDQRGMGTGMKLGLGGTLVVGALSLLFRTNLFDALGVQPSVGGGSSAPAASVDRNDKQVQFVSFVLDDVQNTWARELPKAGHPYQRAKMVLFTDRVQSGCGAAETAMGPFYCPQDARVYIDLGFYNELKTRFGAPGDFAQAYVIAHEVGHHVQNLLGTERKVRAAQQSGRGDVHDLSIRLELQADCYAGVWGHSTQQRQILEEGDVEEGLNAAAAVGDDRIQKQSGRGVHPESWTHGSSAQRVAWFKRGFTSGRIEDCDTFAADRP
jgi:predicted metalloprotease